MAGFQEDDQFQRLIADALTSITGNDKWKEHLDTASMAGPDYSPETRKEIASQVLRDLASTIPTELQACLKRWEGCLATSSTTLATSDALYRNGFAGSDFDGARYSSQAFRQIRQLVELVASEGEASAVSHLQEETSIAEILRKSAEGFRNLNWREMASQYDTMASNISHIVRIGTEVEKRLLAQALK